MSKKKLCSIYCLICNDCIADIGADYGDVRPLDEAQMRKLFINGVQLLDRIDADAVFLAELAAAKCITSSQKEHLVNIVQPHDRNYKLLEFMTRKSVANFEKFQRVLAKRQAHLMPLLVTDGGELRSTCVCEYILFLCVTFASAQLFSVITG